MSLFPRSYVTNDQSTIPPIFLLLDEFDRYSRNAERPERSQGKSFSPKFDIKETKDSFQLFGELPGVEQKQVDMKFTDASTLTIKGHSERYYAQGAAGSHNTTVEDANGVTGTGNKTSQKKEGGSSESEEKFWVTERNIGEFSRSFGFPVPIDQENVKASMKNGILSVVVPKAQKQEGRRIKIESN